MLDNDGQQKLVLLCELEVQLVNCFLDLYMGEKEEELFCEQ